MAKIDIEISPRNAADRDGHSQNGGCRRERERKRRFASSGEGVEKGLGLGLQLVAAATVDDDGEGAMLGEDNLQAADEGVEGF